MKRVAAAVGVFVLLAGVVVGQEPTLTITASATRVGFGAPFEVVVTRAWPTTTTPEEWQDADLAPLVVRLDDVTRETRDGVVVETRRFTAFAFQVGEVAVTAPVLRVTADDGSGMRVAIGDELLLDVTSSLPAGDPGAIELPGGVLPVPESTLGLLALAVLVGGCAFVSVGRVRRRRTAAVDPVVHAQARLAALRQRAPAVDSPADDDAFHVEVAAIVRACLEQRFALRAPEMTTEELVASARTAAVVGEAQRGVLANFLRACDAVKFARGRSDLTARSALCDAAAALVTVTPGGVA